MSYAIRVTLIVLMLLLQLTGYGYGYGYGSSNSYGNSNEHQIVIFRDGFENGSVSKWSTNTNEQLCQYVIENRYRNSNMPLPEHMTIAGLPNNIAANVVTVTAGAEGASMLASNLKDWQNPSQLARLTSVFPHQSYWEIDYGSSPAELVRKVGLGRHSLRSGDQIRIITVNSGSLPAVRSQTVVPNNLVDEDSMLNAVVADIDEHPSSPDGNKTTFFTDGSYIHLGFATPTNPPATGVDLQCFVLWVNLSTAPSNPEDYPSLTAELWENGSFVADLGTKVPTSTTGQLLIFPWSASLLGTANGSLVEIKLIQNQPAGLRVILMDAVAWESLSQIDADLADKDTGWHTITGAEQELDFGNTSIDEVDDLPSMYRSFLDSPVTVSKARIELRGDGVGYFDSLLRTEPRTPSTFIDAGFAIVHPVYTFPFQFMDGGELEWLDSYVGEEETAIDGSDNKVLLFRRRGCTVAFDYLPKSKAEALFKRLKGDQPILISLFPDNGIDSGDLYTFLATASRIDPQQLSNYTRDNELTRMVGYTFVEKLG